jgi:dTDP-4-dehydrorhamnose reductase
VTEAPKILVFGAGGQLGRTLLAGKHPRATIVGVDRESGDVTEPAAVRLALATHAPAAVVNAAAYTAVDRAESEPALAFAVNGDGPANLASACADAGVPLVHVSTDYVFDGTKEGAYTEDDRPNPTGVYGTSKLAGEQAVAAALPRAHLVVRTAWVFSDAGHNFVRTMWRLAREREVLRVVADQRGSPTPADDLAAALVAMTLSLLEDLRLSGLYHWAGRPATTWHGFAEAIVAEARRRGPVATTSVEPISTADYPTAAARPLNAVLDTTKARLTFGLEPPDWRLALARVADSLAAEEDRVA